MPMDACISQAEQRLWQYLEAEGYAGWDPFDGLNSRLFKATPLDRSRLCRLAWLQFFKRCPLNLRPLMLVPKGENAKGLALLASACLRRGDVGLADRFLTRLETMRSPNRPDWCWGYNFDWQARAFYVPQGTPNMVTSVFAGNAFLDRYDLTGRSEDLARAEGVCRFILNELVLDEAEDTACFAYIPGEKARVHNANMLGAAFMARTAARNGDGRWTDVSEKAMRYSVEALCTNGSWPYGEAGHHQFVDNFHTGYNLVSLHGWMQDTGKDLWNTELRRGVSYFLEAFWLPDGAPKYYDNNIYPIDTHCSAMGLVACSRLAEFIPETFGERIALWAVSNMQLDNGSFTYQIHRHFKNTIPYMRWTQCWMAYGLAHLLR